MRLYEVFLWWVLVLGDTVVDDRKFEPELGVWGGNSRSVEALKDERLLRAAGRRCRKIVYGDVESHRGSNDGVELKEGGDDNM